MKSFLFVFGRTPKLSLLELQTFFPKVIIISDAVGLVEVEGSFDGQKAIEMLGGTVKIAQVLGNVKKITPEDLATYIIKEKTGTSVTFGISSYTPLVSVNGNYLNRVKQDIVAQGVSTRFIEPRHEETLSSVVVVKQHVIELIIANYQGRFIIGKTVAVQDFEEWGKRDYGRPFADPKHGMLPPKVARMVINIAIGSRLTMNDEPITLLDPFCGMGTILAEGLLQGAQVIGSDQSTDVVEKAKKNLEWLEGSDTSRKYPILPTVKLFVSEATHVSEKLGKESVDAIVTEPYMGNSKIKNEKLKMKTEDIKNIIKGLEKLYIGCLRDWYKVLKPKGKVVIALPEYAVGGKTYFVKKAIDNCESLGYTVKHGPIEYSRPQAIVRRQFFVLQKN